MRMSRKRSRSFERKSLYCGLEKKQNKQLAGRLSDDVMRQTAQRASVGVLASISMLSMLQPASGEASAINNVISDIPAEFESLSNERDRIRSFDEAKRNAKEAAEALVLAEQDLQAARQDKQDAEASLAEAQKSLDEAKRNLQRIAQELANAQVESAQRTREAIAAQKAVADFAPQVWAQESVVQSVQGRKQGLQASYEQLGQDLGHLSQERNDLEERIRKAWDSVDYAQNRVGDVMAMVNRTKAIVPEQEAKEAQWQEYESQLADMESEVESAESQLEELNSQLDVLQEAKAAAEDAERDARERVKELLNEHAEVGKDLQDSKFNVTEAEKWNTDAAQAVVSAEENYTETKNWQTKADYELANFGAGKGISSGFEYYSWHGAGLNGHQLYQPIEFYTSEKKWDVSLTTGWLSSNTGLPEGSVNGWTDTTVGVTFKNDHKKNDVHYFVNVNVPTGKDNVHQNAMMADNLARFNSFNEGWQFTPGIEVTHKYTERDSITGRLSYTFRGDYKYRRSYSKEEVTSINDEFSYNAVNAEAQEDIDPGNKFTQELEYRHIGDTHQLGVKLTHENATSADYKNTLRYFTDAAGSITNVDQLYGTGTNHDGENWILHLFGNKDMDSSNALQYYVIGNYQAADTGGTHRYYGGLGWRHQFDKKQSGYVMLNFGETHGQSYNWRLNKWDSNRHMKALLLGYDYRLDDSSELRAKLERFNISGSSADSYHGWKMSLMWNKSF